MVSPPDAFEYGAVTPGHLAIPISAASLEVALILCLFKVSTVARQQLAVLYRTMSIGPSIFEHAAEHVTVLVVDFRQPDEAAILERTRLGLLLRVLLHLLREALAGTQRPTCLVRLLDIISGSNVSLSLEYVAFLVFELDCTIGFVFDELSDNLGTVGHRQLSSLTTALILEPFALKGVAVGIVHRTLALPEVLLHATFIEFAVAEKNLDVSILESPAIEAAFKNLIRCVEEDALALRSALAPLTLVD